MACPAAVRELKQRWIGREVQIDRLVRILGPREAMVSPVFVGGLPSSGKSAVVRDLFQALSLPHAYINCIESSTPRLVPSRSAPACTSSMAWPKSLMPPEAFTLARPAASPCKCRTMALLAGWP